MDIKISDKQHQSLRRIGELLTNTLEYKELHCIPLEKVEANVCTPPEVKTQSISDHLTIEALRDVLEIEEQR